MFSLSCLHSTCPPGHVLLHELMTQAPTFLFPAPDDISLRRCRAEAFVALGQYPEALEDLEAVCKAEPTEHEVSGGEAGEALEPHLTAYGS